MTTMQGLPVIETTRYLLRRLTLADVTPRYLGWFSAPGAARIQASGTTQALSHLHDYVATRIDRDDILFLGIFDRQNGAHLGNVKYEPVDSALGFAVMGIFIGEVSARGRGLAGEVLAASATWLKQERGIGEIVLGVEADNLAAIKAYEKLGFKVAPTPHIAPQEGCLTMVWSLS